MEEANKGLCYTQVPVSISIKDGCDDIAYLPWYGIEASEDDVITASFGKFGFYGEWRINEWLLMTYLQNYTVKQKHMTL